MDNNYHRLPSSPAERPPYTSSNTVPTGGHPQAPFAVRPLPRPASAVAGGPGGSSLAGGPSGSGYRTAPVHRREMSNSSSHVMSPTLQPIPPLRSHSPLPPTPRYPSNGHPTSSSSYLPSAPPISNPGRPSTSTSPSFNSSHFVLPAGTVCTATTDHESLSVVSLANLNSVAGIKEKILSKLHIPDDDFFMCSFFLTKIGGGQGRQVLNDDELWDVCVANKGGEGKPVTIFVKLGVPPTSPGSAESGMEAGASAVTTRSFYRDGSMVPPPDRRAKSPSISSEASSHLGNVMLDYGAGPSNSHSSGGDEYFNGDIRTRSEPRTSWLATRTPSGGSGGGLVGSPESGMGGGGLSPPIERSHRDRAGSLTPTAPDDWDPSRRPASSSYNSGTSTIGPPSSVNTATGIRRLPPGPPNHFIPQGQQYLDDGRQRMQATTGGLSPRMSPSPAQLWQQSQQQAQHQAQIQHSQQHPSSHHAATGNLRPFPSHDLRANHHQYQLVPGPSSSSPNTHPSAGYHNLDLQSQYQSQGPPNSSPYQSPYGKHSPNPGASSNGAFAASSSSHRMLNSRSIEGLRTQFSHGPGPEGRPPIPGPIPPQYLSRGDGSGRNSVPQSQQYREGPPRPHPPSMPFDARIMSGTQSSGHPSFRPSAPPSSSSSSFHPHPSTSQQQRPYTSPQPPNGFPPPHSQGPPPRGYDTFSSRAHSRPREEPYVPDLRELRPGGLVHEARRTSDGQVNARPPMASMMTAPDPTLDAKKRSTPSNSGSNASSSSRYDGFDSTDMYMNAGGRRESSGEIRRSSAGYEQTGSRRSDGVSPIHSREAMSPRDPPQAMATPSRIRPSRNSNAASPSSSGGNSAGDAYGGMEDESAPYTSSTDRRSYSSSDRNSSSAPSTPATDHVYPIPAVKQATSFSNTYPDTFEEDIGDDSTWFPVNQPVKPISAVAEAAIVSLNRNTVLPTSTPARQSSQTFSPGGTQLLERTHDEAESATIGAGNWAAACLDSFPREEEGTITKPIILPAMQSTILPPKSAEGFFEDPRFYHPVDAPIAKYDDEFGDDFEEGTYLPGYGPDASARPSKPVISTTPATPSTPTASAPLSSQVAFTLYDEPGSGHRSDGGTLKEERPNLSIVTSPIPPPTNLPAKSSLSGPMSSSTSGSNSPNLGGVARSTGPKKSSQGSATTSLPPHFSISPPVTPPAGTSSPTRRPPFSRTPRNQSSFDSNAGASIARRGSLAERDNDDWAFRPPVETVLENLEDFFPEHDLDKPIFDAPPTAPSSTEVSPEASTSKADVAVIKRGPAAAIGLAYKKSIRYVAQNQRRSLLKGKNSVSEGLGLHPSKGSKDSMLRRKSTKLFGNRLEEVTAGQLKKMESPISEDPQNFSFKWIKGELIGRGTFGHVYLAYNVTAGEFIAVKQVELPKTRSDQADIRQQGMVSSLKAEIELLKDLEHPKIVEYLGMEETIDNLSIFLEYVPGGSVGRIVRTHGKFEEDIIKYFTYQILEGLEYLHSLGILHRDLKADNILCDHQGRCKISDFGTSKKSTDIYSNNAEMSLQGSIFWMAPEVINNAGQGYSAKADIWSLGCVCLEMFAGRRPWSDDEAIQAMFKLGSGRTAPPVPDDVVLSSEASHFLDDCLKADAAERPRASHLMRHRFLTLPLSWSFLQTSLYRAIASARPHELPFHP